MTDQLSLALDLALPNLPAGIRPMLPKPAAAAFDSPDHLFEPSWGGRRAIAFVEPPNATTGPGAGHPFRLLLDGTDDVAASLPELADIAARLEARSAVIDGEVVVVDPLGRADPAALEARLAGASGPAVAFLAFDLLYLDGRPLLGLPLVRRRDLLRRALHPGGQVVTVPSIAGEGRALHEAVVAQGIAGVMARVRTSPYLPGIRSRMWLFVPGVAVPVDREAGRIADPADPGDPADAADPGSITSGAAPVLALIRRLPLGDD